MARPNQEAIDTFMSITGASQDVAIQLLEEHGGDLNEAVNSHFTRGDTRIRPASVPAVQNDLMDIDDDPIEVEPQRPFPLLSAATNLNPFSLLDQNFRRSFLEGSSIADFPSGAPRVTHPREVRQIPIDFKDDNTQSSNSGLGPRIEDVTESAYGHGPEVHGTVIVDDDDNEDIPTAPSAHYSGQSEREVGRNLAPSAPGINSMDDYANDIEEEMIRAAIEASKRETIEGIPNQDIGVANDAPGSSAQQTESRVEDTDLARAVSLSLKTAEQEKALREQGKSAGIAETRVSVAPDVEELRNKTTSNGGQGVGLEPGSSSLQDETEEEEQPLVRQRSRRISFGSDSFREVSEMEDTPPSSPGPRDTGVRPQSNGSAFPDEWGGISSEEHDEAVMLEAALFGGVPEATAYRFGYPSQEPNEAGLDRDFYPRPVPRPPSPTLEAQRLLREQQDDEYLASLQADREKELKAIEEAEARRLSEKAAREAAIEEEKQKAEESRRKLLEEEKYAGRQSQLHPLTVHKLHHRLPAENIGEGTSLDSQIFKQR